MQFLSFSKITLAEYSYHLCVKKNDEIEGIAQSKVMKCRDQLFLLIIQYLDLLTHLYSDMNLLTGSKMAKLPNLKYTRPGRH